MNTFHNKLQPDQEPFKEILSNLASDRQTQDRTNHGLDKISPFRMSVHNSVLKLQLGGQLKMTSFPCVILSLKFKSQTCLSATQVNIINKV